MWNFTQKLAQNILELSRVLVNALKTNFNGLKLFQTAKIG